MTDERHPSPLCFRRPCRADRVKPSSFPAPSDRQPNLWFVRPLPKPGADLRLFLFPYAGAGPAVFGKWIMELPEHIEGIIAHFPGRGSRHKEPPINDIFRLAERLSQSIQSLLDKPFALFGHSFGAFVAFELARQMHRQQLREPEILFVSGCGAPQMPDPHPPTSMLSDDQFLETLAGMGGIDSELLRQPEMLQLLMPMIRADFKALESYHYDPNVPPVRCPIMAFGGLADGRVSPEQLEGWAVQTRSYFKSQYFPEDHFFIKPYRRAIIESIATEIGALARAKR
jgi:medium-chain acyl-[acyl-carrier-protein] hydrolase